MILKILLAIRPKRFLCVFFAVGSIAFDRLICENRELRRDREVMALKLSRSKAALQDTLVRLARANMHKQVRENVAFKRTFT